ncbi:hypothetical protein F4861DRAFT_430113 [Xylaria intraflava]|nr:hypothetical protein F4861DRAFT_430113 [Xylaria intraflava]
MWRCLDSWVTDRRLNIAGLRDLNRARLDEGRLLCQRAIGIRTSASSGRYEVGVSCLFAQSFFFSFLSLFLSSRGFTAFYAFSGFFFFLFRWSLNYLSSPGSFFLFSWCWRVLYGSVVYNYLLT